MKIGDQVAVIGMNGIAAVNLIDRETKLYWYVRNLRFRKSDLHAPAGDCFNIYHIEPATQNHIDELRKRRLVMRLSETKWSKLDLETLEKVFATVCGMAETKEN